MAIKKFKTKRHKRINPKQFIQLTFFFVGFLLPFFFILLFQCLSCLIIKCMLLTFIFNYIPLAEAFATLPHFLPSIFNLAFLLYQVDGYLCCSLNTNTKEFLMTREKKHKEILFWRSTRNPLEKRRRERER